MKYFAMDTEMKALNWYRSASGEARPQKSHWSNPIRNLDVTELAPTFRPEFIEAAPAEAVLGAYRGPAFRHGTSSAKMQHLPAFDTLRGA